MNQMPEAIVITPVKDSPKTTIQTIESICMASGQFQYIVYDDFSGTETRELLFKFQKNLGFQLINLSELTQNPSPNYKIVLIDAARKATEANAPLIIIESDVVIRKETIQNLIAISRNNKRPGLIGAATVGSNGLFNFPYEYLENHFKGVIPAKHSLSFCCTLLSPEFLASFNFENLSSKKDWFDVYISRQARKLGFQNYLDLDEKVLHQPHSSRPWKQLKYTNPIKYYFYKYIKNRDRI
jgi:GT2 family glycosyltransferase